MWKTHQQKIAELNQRQLQENQNRKRAGLQPLTPVQAQPQIVQAETLIQNQIQAASSQVFKGVIFELIELAVWALPLLIAFQAVLVNLAPRWMAYNAFSALPETVKVVIHFGRFVASPVTVGRELIIDFASEIVDAVNPFSRGGDEKDAAQVSSGDRVQAMLSTIAYFEGADYDVLVGGSKITSFDDHPRQMVWIESIQDYSSAAGRYQFIDGTWDTYSRKAGCSDFSPECQDKAAIALLDDIGALAAIESGDRERAITLIGTQWASFPGSLGKGQPQYSVSEIKAKYEEFLGASATNNDGPLTFPIQGLTMAIADITSGFGPRTIFGGQDMHEGIDIGVSGGTPVVAMTAGEVTQVKPLVDQYQIKVRVNNSTEHIYIHIQDVTVAVGDRVDAGQVLGVVANTSQAAINNELSTGDHLDVRIIVNGQAVDPAPILASSGSSSDGKPITAQSTNAISSNFSRAAQSYFNEVALGSEYGNASAVRRRWETNICMKIDAPESIVPKIEQVTSELTQLTGVQFDLNCQGEPNFKFFYVPAEDFTKYESNATEGQVGHVWLKWSGGEINQATVLVASNHLQPTEEDHVIREELTQAMGILKDSWEYPDSIFYQGWTDTNRYSDIDKQVIRMLYQ